MDDPDVTVLVTSAPISVSDCEQLAASSDGALVVFAGLVRDHNEGKAVTGLSYESYVRMAEQQMWGIGIRAQQDHGANRVLLAHRTGDLRVGEVSVVTAVSAPHRDAAFSACRFCIDAIKEGAAIWKKELFATGESRWAQGS